MAIAFDAAVDGGLTLSGTSLTWSHTVTGSNPILFVGVFGDLVSGDPTCGLITGVTYNGVSLTQIPTNSPVFTPSDRCGYLFYLAGPATGTHDVVVSGFVLMVIAGVSASYTGAKQTGIPDSSAQNTATSANDITTTTTVVAANSWTILYERNTFGAATAGTGSTQRVSSANGIGLFDSNGPLAAGAQSQQVQTVGHTPNWGTIMASFAPFTDSGFLLLYPR